MAKKIDLENVLEKNLGELSDRARDVVRARFGITDEKPQTLDAIGKRLGITRERVRQIVQASITQVNAAEETSYLGAQRALADHIRSQGGIVHIDRLVEHFFDMHGTPRNVLKFFVAASEDVELVERHKVYPIESAVHMKDFDFDKWHALHQDVVAHFDKEGYICTHDELYAIVKNDHKHLDSAMAREHIHVSSEIGENPFGKWGRADWGDVTPKSIRDKVYLVLGHEGRPLHFREIAEAIDAHDLGKGVRKTHPQTVHNELIKDDRFVLIGRGTYGLQSDDYVMGSVRDIIRHILDTNTESMTAQTIIDEVLKHRNVKPSTIKINLHAVAKKEGDTYTLK